MAPNLPQIWTAWSAKIEIITILYMLNMLETNNIRQKKYWKKHTFFEAKMLGNQLFCFVLMLTEIPPRDPTQAPPNQHQNHQRPPKDHRDTTETHQEVTDKPRHHRDTIDTAPWHYRDAPPRPAPGTPDGACLALELTAPSYRYWEKVSASSKWKNYIIVQCKGEPAILSWLSCYRFSVTQCNDAATKKNRAEGQKQPQPVHTQAPQLQLPRPPNKAP
jgi:hypothetical protein